MRLTGVWVYLFVWTKGKVTSAAVVFNFLIYKAFDTVDHMHLV